MDALIAFEAAGRLSGFAQAGEELNVTASAISQQIKSLERTLGVQLFARGHRSVELTQNGREFSNSVSVALKHLSNAASELTDGDVSKQITIAADTSIVAHWLMPRLEELKDEFPDHRFRIVASDVEADLLKSNFQVAILHGQAVGQVSDSEHKNKRLHGGWQGIESRLLFQEEVFPVCAPSYLGEVGEPLELQMLETSDLLDLEYENWNWMNWTIWLTEVGASSSQTSRKIVSNNYASLIDAAKRGMGFALAWRHFHEDELAAGALIAPFSQSVKTQNGYYLAWPYNQPADAIDDDVRGWLLAQCVC